MFAENLKKGSPAAPRKKCLPVKYWPNFNNTTIEKVNSIYDQSAVIPYRFADDELQIMLITSLHKKHWIIPKGIIENNLTPASSAEKEAFEEAGIRGRLSPHSVGEYQYEKWGGVCTVTVFLMAVEEVLQLWPEANLRTRKWVSIAEAEKLVDIESLKAIIRNVPILIKSEKEN
jgi:8-oxo-dGTP pyrophosphatase MutT (NUDIX family)